MSFLSWHKRSDRKTQYYPLTPGRKFWQHRCQAVRPRRGRRIYCPPLGFRIRSKRLSCAVGRHREIDVWPGAQGLENGPGFLAEKFLDLDYLGREADRIMTQREEQPCTEAISNPHGPRAYDNPPLTTPSLAFSPTGTVWRGD